MLGRRVGRMERRRPPENGGWETWDWTGAAWEIERERRAMMALVAFAQDLAGVVPPPAPSLPPLAPAVACAPPAAIVPAPPIDVLVPPANALLTWEDIRRIPWTEPEPPDTSPPAPDRIGPPPPGDWVDPWGGGGFVFPSYAGKAQDGEE